MILDVPEKIKVGFNERSDTYSGFLAYVVYTKPDGTIAKEKSWKGWIDNRIPVKDLKNTPTSGFVLNRKAGGCKSGWEYRQAYCRVWDPRGWEVEITIENLLYILEECSTEKGKVLVGDFVYSWCGKDLVLLPTSSQDYQDSLVRRSKTTKISPEDLVVGDSYQYYDDQIVYLGRWNIYHPYIGNRKYFLFHRPSNQYKKFEVFMTLPKYIYYKVASGAYDQKKVSELRANYVDDPLPRGVKIVGWCPETINDSIEEVVEEKLVGSSDLAANKSLFDDFIKNPCVKTYDKVYDRWNEVILIIPVAKKITPCEWSLGHVFVRQRNPISGTCFREEFIRRFKSGKIKVEFPDPEIEYTDCYSWDYGMTGIGKVNVMGTCVSVDFKKGSQVLCEDRYGGFNLKVEFSDGNKKEYRFENIL